MAIDEVSASQAKSDTEASPRRIAFEILLKSTHPKLQPLVQKTDDLATLYKEILEMLKKPRIGGEIGDALEDLAALGERVLELEDLQDIVRMQWANREQRNAAHRKLLLCGIDSPQGLLRALGPSPSGSSKCALNELLDECGYAILRPETIRSLSAELHVRVRQNTELVEEGSRPLLVTAPHNIFLLRDGQPVHVMEEYTTLIAQRIARRLGGCCLCWSRSEQHRSELFWNLGKQRGRKDDFSNLGAYLDPRNRDPNYLTTEEVSSNSWFKQMVAFSERFCDHLSYKFRPMLHIDCHGCRDPPCIPSHLTIGLAAMRHEAESGRGPLTVDRVEAFGAELQSELTAALSGLNLKPAAALVRLLQPVLSNSEEGVEPFSGAWPLHERLVTQSQQAVSYAGFSHSCQLEMSKALRKALVRDDVALTRFAKALFKAWSTAEPMVLPALPSCIPPHEASKVANMQKPSQALARSRSRQLSVGR